MKHNVSGVNSFNTETSLAQVGYSS